MVHSSSRYKVVFLTSAMVPFPMRNIYIAWIAVLLSHMSAPSRGEELTDKMRNAETCRLFMASSTIPNAGIGVFTAVDLKEGDAVGYPDLAIPVTDLDWHNGGRRQASLIDIIVHDLGPLANGSFVSLVARDWVGG